MNGYAKELWFFSWLVELVAGKALVLRSFGGFLELWEVREVNLFGKLICSVSCCGFD